MRVEATTCRTSSVAHPESRRGAEPVPCRSEFGLQRSRLRRDPALYRAGGDGVTGAGNFGRQARGGGGVVELAECVLQPGERLEVKAGPLPGNRGAKNSAA